MKRAASTFVLHTNADGSDFVSFFDGIGCSPRDVRVLGRCVVFIPGKADRRYSTTDSDSCAR